MKNTIKNWTAAALVIFLSLSLISCTVKGKPSLDGRTRQKLDKIMKDSISYFRSPGMILAVWIPGQNPYIKAKGLSDIKTGKRLRPSERFRIGSNTKVFTATVILQLADKGVLKLDDKLGKYFNFFPNSENITIRMLLNHTSGLFNYSEDKDFGKVLEADLLHPFTPRQLINYAVKHDPYFPPGKGFHYSNTNTVLLGMIISKATGVPLRDQIKKRIVDKLALKNSYYPEGAETNGEICHGYMPDEKGKLEDCTKMNVSWAGAAGAMISDIYDQRTFITAVTDGSLLSKDLQEERMTSWVTLSDSIKAEFPSARYGYNIFKFGGFVGHNGGLPGTISYMVRDPQSGVVLIMMMNTQPADSDASLKVLKEVIQTIIPGTKV